MIAIVTGTLCEAIREAPFGEIAAATGGLTPDETIGFIGERFDIDAGLQHLNARYYDPRLGLFIQLDWFEVTDSGMGTNRYSYSFNDPVNLRDPGGNDTLFDPRTYGLGGPNRSGGSLLAYGDGMPRGPVPSQAHVNAVRDLVAAMGLVAGSAAIISPMEKGGIGHNSGITTPQL